MSEYIDNYLTDENGQRWVKLEYAQTYVGELNKRDQRIAELEAALEVVRFDRDAYKASMERKTEKLAEREWVSDGTLPIGIDEVEIAVWDGVMVGRCFGAYADDDWYISNYRLEAGGDKVIAWKLCTPLPKPPTATPENEA